MTQEQSEREKRSFYNTFKKVCVMGQIYIFTIIISKIKKKKMKLLQIDNEESDQSNSHETEINEDYIAKCMGPFGIWQAIVCTAVASTRFIALWNLLSIIFLTPTTKFACVKFEGNATVEVENSTCYNNCFEYEYHSNVFQSTLVSTFGLICDEAWLGSFTQTVLMFGVFVGAWVFGWYSDTYGRRNALRLSTLLSVIFMIIAPFSPNYLTFTSVRFLIGITSGGIIIVSSVYILEVVGMQYREVAGCFAILPDGLAEATMAIFAYFSTTWDIFLLLYWVASVLIFFIILPLPETPRWLVSKGKLERAVKLITKAAKCNKLKTDHIRDEVTKGIQIIKINQKVRRKWTYFDLFRTKELRLNTICSFILYAAVGIGFYGVNQFVSFLGSNVYVTVVALGLVQVPMSLLSIVLNKLCRRKTMTSLTFLITGLSMIILTILPRGHWTEILVGGIGMAAIDIAFITLYIFTFELFPTPLRNMAFGLGSAGSKMAAMVTPFIAALSPQWIAALTLAILPFIATVVCLFLPETKGKHVKDTVS